MNAKKKRAPVRPKPRPPAASCEAAVKHTILIARSLISLFGIALVVLGILFWTGHALSLLNVHMMLGGLFVICMWVLAVLGFVTPGNRGFALLVLVWSLIVPALGVTQVSMLPGSDHWVIQVVHLLVGIIAMGLGHALARRLSRRPADATVIPRTA
jgi:uncharacterized membrane protein YczE